MRKGTTRKATADLTLEEARAEYKAIRGRAWQCATAQEFDAKVGEDVVSEAGVRATQSYMLSGVPVEVATARVWVACARLARFTCRRCAGTGAFITGSLNGQPTGPGGICYRCEGKGYQDDADARRNYGADIHQKVY